MQTLRQKIEALPEPERSARRAFYTDDEWEFGWDLNAYPFQIEPATDDWKIWTIIAGPGTGKSYAGEHWAWEKFFDKRANVLCLFQSRESVDDHFATFFQRGEMWSGHFEHSLRDEVYTQRHLRDVTTRNMMTCAVNNARHDPSQEGVIYDYIWADEVLDAEQVVDTYPRAAKFLFTQPTRLHPDTLLSRAGDGRTY